MAAHVRMRSECISSGSCQLSRQVLPRSLGHHAGKGLAGVDTAAWSEQIASCQPRAMPGWLVEQVWHGAGATLLTVESRSGIGPLVLCMPCC